MAKISIIHEFLEWNGCLNILAWFISYNSWSNRLTEDDINIAVVTIPISGAYSRNSY